MPVNGSRVGFHVPTIAVLMNLQCTTMSMSNRGFESMLKKIKSLASYASYVVTLNAQSDAYICQMVNGKVSS